MRAFIPCFFLTLTALPCFSATFGTVVNSQAAASYSDVVLDEPRQRLYLVNSAANRVEVWSIPQRQFLANIATGTLPISLALSPDNTRLYVTAYSSTSLNIIDLTKAVPSVTSRIALPASPEGVAVGKDGRLLISTVGSGGQNTLLIYNPQANSVNNVAIAPAAPTPPTLPAPSGRAFLSYHSKLIATKDGNTIIGTNVTSGGTTNNRVAFVYEVSSGTVLRSRILTNLSNVLSVSPDGSKFMAGYSLIDTATLTILAQENVANSPFAFPTGTNFNAQANQGGSVFSPDGSVIYGAFNFAPVQVPAAKPNVTRLLYNDPDNLLIKLGLQLPENLSGQMVINKAGDTIYGLSESGFIILPVGQLSQNPLAQVNSQIVLLTSDQCGVTTTQSAVTDAVTNVGRGRLTATAQSYTLSSGGLATTTTNAVPGLGNNGGGGFITVGGGAGGGVIVPFPGNTNPGGNATTATATTSTVPTVQMAQTSSGANLNFRFNANAAKTPGTAAANDFLVQSNEAVNIPSNIRVFQNFRDSDAPGTIIPIAQNVSGGEALMDLLQDTVRQKLYIANSGLNQIEVFDLKTQQFTAPIKVGQLPHAMALSTDGVTMYVANTGGETISVVNLDTQIVTGRVTFPAVPANVAVGLSYPTSIAPSQRGPQFVMSDGSLWKIDGMQALPRVLNPAVFGGSATTVVRTVSGGNPSVRTLAATPGGEYVLLATGAGNVYLYDASIDDYTVGKQIFTTATSNGVPATLAGFLGPVGAGPAGKYFLVNNTLLNSSLTPIAAEDQTTGGTVAGGTLPGRGTQTTATTTSTRPVEAVSANTATTFARFSQPVRTGNTSTVTDAGMIEIVDANTGQLLRSVPTLEGSPSTVSGTQRVAVSGRTLVVDATNTNAYILSASGLSIIPLTPVAPGMRPQITAGGIVNLASYQTTAAPGGLVGIFGQNLGTQAVSSGTTLPTLLGGTCVTLNNQPLPLELVSPGQINAQLPIGLAAGKYTLIARSVTNKTASQTPVQVTVAKYAPAVFVSGGQAAIVHSDGSYVTKQHPTTRDERLSLFATGLGATHGGTVKTGAPSPSSPLALTDAVQVYFGNPGYSQSAIIVEFSGLVPGLVGIYQINLRVPGTHMKGDALPVSIKIGGVSSPLTGPVIPTVAVQ